MTEALEARLKELIFAKGRKLEKNAQSTSESTSNSNHIQHQTQKFNVALMRGSTLPSHQQYFPTFDG